MTKSERLLHLIKLLKERESLHIHDMVDACKVSHRTIYRDLNSLVKLNVPIKYDNGYRLVKDAGIPFEVLNKEERDLLTYAVKNNPLAKKPYFSTKFKSIEDKILSNMNDRFNNIISFEDSLTSDNTDSNGLSLFLEAAYTNKKILIRNKDISKDWELFTPKSVQLKSDSLMFIVKDELGVEKSISSENVLAIKMIDTQPESLMESTPTEIQKEFEISVES